MNEKYSQHIFPILCSIDTNGSDNSIPMAYLTLDHQLQVHTHLLYIHDTTLRTFTCTRTPVRRYHDAAWCYVTQAVVAPVNRRHKTMMIAIKAKQTASATLWKYQEEELQHLPTIQCPVKSARTANLYNLLFLSLHVSVKITDRLVGQLSGLFSWERRKSASPGTEVGGGAAHPRASNKHIKRSVALKSALQS